MNFPESFAFRRAAEQGRDLTGTVDVARFGRLAYPYERSGTVRAKLSFGLDGHERIRLDGEIHGEVAAICQRCLKPMAQQVSARVEMLILSESPAEAGIGEDDEYLVAAEDSLDLMSLLEDEVLLALPMVPRHAAGACETNDALGLSPVRDNPFLVLAALQPRSTDADKGS
jgi:uncharacterized protein